MRVVFVKDRLQDRGDKKKDWSKVLAFYERQFELTASSAPTHYDYLDAAGAYWFDESNQPNVTTADVFGSPFSLGISTNPGRTSEALGLTHSSTFDLSPRMSDIRIPSLILWGTEDGVIPAEMADDAYLALGTPTQEKRRVVFENAAHSPMFEAPEAFEFEVRAFLEGIRNAR